MENVITDHEIVKSEITTHGYLKIKELTIKNGEKEYTRQVINPPNTVAAIIYDTKKKKYIFVEQYRAGAEGVMVEVVAGGIEDGEKTEQAMKREIMEETGYKVDEINHVKDFYLSPGTSTEVMALFYVEVSERVDDVSEEGVSIVEVEQIGLGGRLFFQDPLNMEMNPGEEGKILPPYQLIDAKSLIAVMWRENNSVLKEMADVITQAKIRSL